MSLQLLKQIQISTEIHVLKYRNQVLLAKKDTGKWYKLSDEIYSILLYGEKENLTVDELLKRLEDDEDKLLIKNVLNDLSEIGIIQLDDVDSPKTAYFITFAITNRCNLYCKHCSYNAIYTNLQSPNDKMSTEDVKKTLDKIIELNPSGIAFTGGEPFIRKDFIELLHYVKKSFKGNIVVMTNSILINEGNIQDILDTVDQIDISIDGVDETTCTKIRGSGVFTTVINKINLLQSYGFSKISLSMIDTTVTHEYIPQFLKMNEKLGTKPIIREFDPVGRGLIFKEQLMLMDNNQKGTKNTNLDQDQLIKIQRKTLARRCGVAETKFFIDSDGKLYGCASLRQPQYELGEIAEIDNLKSYINDNLQKQTKGFCSIHDNIPKCCQKCNVNIFCIECLADIYRLCEEPDFESFCEERKNILTSLIWDTN